jgi:hypothetical protein
VEQEVGSGSSVPPGLGREPVAERIVIVGSGGCRNQVMPGRTGRSELTAAARGCASVEA